MQTYIATVYTQPHMQSHLSVVSLRPFLIAIRHKLITNYEPHLFTIHFPLRTRTKLPPPLSLSLSIRNQQGIITTLLVTCNCKILKLYTTPRLHKSRKGNKYAELQDGHIGISHGGGDGSSNGIVTGLSADSSRYAVLSVANPNYKHDDGMDGCGGQCRTDDDDDDDDCLVDDEENVFGDHRSQQCHHHYQHQHQQQSPCLLQMTYNDDLMSDRPQPQPQQQQQPIARSGAMMAAAAAQSVVFDRLVLDGLPVKDLMDGPVPQPV